MPNAFSTYKQENGGRVLLLFLLFLLAIYEFIEMGFPIFAVICLSPVLVLGVYTLFNWRMSAFWALIVVNYFVQMKAAPFPEGVPTSAYNELLEMLLLAIAIIDARKTPHFERTGNLMLFALLIWGGFCIIEVLNDTCGLGLNISGWYTGARSLFFQTLYAFLVFSIYIDSPQILRKYIYIWACLSLFTVFWTWKQQYIGFTPSENAWLQTRGRTTHILQAGTLIRYFSTYSDAANYGCGAAATAVFFFIYSITTKIKKDRIFFAIVGALVVWGMFASGTRTAIVTMGAGFAVFIVLSKSFKIAIPATIILSIGVILLVFTDIGQGNQQIRRMRSAFNKKDASSNVRDINQAAIKKYIADAPWGIGLGASYDNVPANNKYKKLSTIPPDSEYVFIWVHTGPIGITVFVVTMLMMLAGACWVVMFKLKNRTIMGIGAGLTCAFVSMQLAGYGNQVLLQFPNCLTFYGGLAIVYILPYIESDWIEYENKLIAEQEEKKRLKLEKKLASRV